MKLNSKLEEKIKLEALGYLKKGKETWDVPHTLAAVYYVRELVKVEGGDEKILVTAMYFHDTGYPELTSDYDFENLLDAKRNHERIGAENVIRDLSKIEGYSNEEIGEIASLVRYHDTLDGINSFNRQLVMESDSLAALDWERVVPNFDKENCAKYLEYFKKNRPNKFRTDTGKGFLDQLLPRAEDYVK